MECVTVNLTLVYALFAYSTIKQKDINSILVSADSVCLCMHVYVCCLLLSNQNLSMCCSI